MSNNKLVELSHRTVEPWEATQDINCFYDYFLTILLSFTKINKRRMKKSIIKL